MVYNCKHQGWMSEKECKECFNRNHSHKLSNVKHCRRDNVTDIESDNYRDMDND